MNAVTTHRFYYQEDAEPLPASVAREQMQDAMRQRFATKTETPRASDDYDVAETLAHWGLG